MQLCAKRPGELEVARGISRALSSGVERSVCIGEATGSNPVGSTSAFFFSLQEKKNAGEKEKCNAKCAGKKKSAVRKRDRKRKIAEVN